MANRIKLRKFELNRSGVAQILKSPEMEQILKERADEIAGRCGDGYAADTKLMGTRYISSVYTDTREAMRDNLERNTILKALQ